MKRLTFLVLLAAVFSAILLGNEKELVEEKSAAITINTPDYSTVLYDQNNYITQNNNSTASSSIGPGYGLLWAMWWSYAVKMGCITQMSPDLPVPLIDCNCLERIFGREHPFFKRYCGWIKTPPPIF
ncbi:MAG: hypothetical protein HY606_00685 [Planctomycetes bacterium]|nr:hypothetical protein [Planctomycetota bacterium]